MNEVRNITRLMGAHLKSFKSNPRLQFKFVLLRFALPVCNFGSVVGKIVAQEHEEIQSSLAPMCNVHGG